MPRGARRVGGELMRAQQLPNHLQTTGNAAKPTGAVGPRGDMKQGIYTPPGEKRAEVDVWMSPRKAVSGGTEHGARGFGVTARRGVLSPCRGVGSAGEEPPGRGGALEKGRENGLGLGWGLGWTLG